MIGIEVNIKKITTIFASLSMPTLLMIGCGGSNESKQENFSKQVALGYSMFDGGIFATIITKKDEGVLAVYNLSNNKTSFQNLGAESVHGVASFDGSGKRLLATVNTSGRYGLKLLDVSTEEIKELMTSSTPLQKPFVLGGAACSFLVEAQNGGPRRTFTPVCENYPKYSGPSIKAVDYIVPTSEQTYVVELKDEAGILYKISKREEGLVGVGVELPFRPGEVFKCGDTVCFLTNLSPLILAKYDGVGFKKEDVMSSNLENIALKKNSKFLEFSDDSFKIIDINDRLHAELFVLKNAREAKAEIYNFDLRN